MALLSLTSTTTPTFDVVIVGAGMIGLTIANRFLRHTHLSVCIVESAHRTCAGATGAGQGYIWTGHINPTSEVWPLTSRSKHLWAEFVADIQASGLDPEETIGWRNTGSLLFASTAEQSFALHERLHLLADAGVQAEFWDSATVRKSEPALRLDAEGAAGYVHGDAQIDAKLAVKFIQENNRTLGAGGRYNEYFGCPVTNFIRSPAESCIQGLETALGNVYAKKGVIVAAGAWTSGLMQVLCKQFKLHLITPIKPRKGHLLVLEKPHVHLNYGLMEFSYTGGHQEDYGVDTTATLDTAGMLLLGSSREFKGFDTTPEDEVMEHVLRKAAQFLPALSSFSISSVSSRVGLRPYASGGKPIIGPVDALPGLFLASGHEGQGLMLSWGTAEMIVDMVMEWKKSMVDSDPFLPGKRFV